MKVIILGAGRVGCSIARYLAFSGNDITVVDPSEDLLRRLSDTFDVQPIIGKGCHPDVLIKAGIEQAAMLIAATSSDEVNLLACTIARQMNFKGKTIARIRSRAYVTDTSRSYISQMMIDDIIMPEQEIANALYRSTQTLGAFDVIPVHDMKIVGIRCSEGAAALNTPIRLLSGLVGHWDWSVLCLRRQGEAHYPGSNDVFLPGDELYFLASQNDIAAIMESFGLSMQATRKLLIVGAGHVGLTLAQMIEDNDEDVNVTIIERTGEHAELAAQTLNRTTVLKGDALDQEILFEANIPQTDLTITVTDDDKVNILSAIMAKQMGCKRSLALINNALYTSFVSALKIDAIINPNNITVSTLVRTVRQGHIKSLYSIAGLGEVLEAHVSQLSYIVGVDIDSVNIEGRAHVVAILRNGQTTFMPKHVIVSVGDILIIMAHKEMVHRVEELFAPRLYVSSSNENS